MKHAVLFLGLSLAACSSSSSSTEPANGASTHATTSASGGAGGASAGGAGGAATTTTAAGGASTSSSSSSSTSTSTSSSSTSTKTGTGGAGGKADPCGGCPATYTCGTANGLPVCRAPSGVPLFTGVTLVMMENTSLSTLSDGIAAGTAPNMDALTKKCATASDYHGVTHPSLPNYIALTSGDPQGIGCDCKAAQGQGDCNKLTCNSLLGMCSCNQAVQNLADQLETAGKSWMAFGEDMGAPCNLTDSGNYAVRHVPFLYYDDIQTNAQRCQTHVVDFTNYDPKKPHAFDYIAPNLVDDMHDPNLNPDLSHTKNIANGDAWLGPQVDAIVASPEFAKGRLLVVAWDEDDNSGAIFKDDPIPMFVISPYAKGGGYVSAVTADHYSLLATIEDGLGLPRLGQAAQARPVMADTLADYFPAK